MTSDKAKKSRTRKIAGIGFSFLLTGIFLYIAFYGVRFGDVLGIIGKASWAWVFVLTVTLLTSHFLRAVRWKVILSSVKPDTSVLNLFGSLMVGYGVNCVIPRLGEISRAVLLGKWENLSGTSMFGTVIVERVIDVISFIAALLISVFIYNGNLYESFPWLKSSLYAASVLMAGVIIFLFLVIRFKEKFYSIILKLVSRISVSAAHRLANVFNMLIEGFSSLKGLKNIVYTIILTVAVISVYSLNSYLGFLCLGMQNMKEVGFSTAWVLMSISSLGVVIPTPGGTGSYHVITQTALVLLFGFSSEMGLAYAVLNHAVSTVVFIITALFFFFFLNYKYSKKSGKKEKLVDFIETNMDSL
ncbi:MAG: flippase-like domain-containing protein [Ignavibacteria bacterium]|nr:flippase-like domain-containing protein [Ignavibacteria bacterium]MCU7502621.1 flippase-like domain-containing protein [Ignavibacteria bacterium]MCU7515176.1 flippase-like domain-containing protein [Ignavibacteria bacterium]